MSAHRPVNFHKGSRIPWPYCIRCGLLYLKNEVTRRAIKAACPAGQEEIAP